MTVKLDRQPEVEAGLVAQAEARGLSLEAYLQLVLKERSVIPVSLKASKAAVKACDFRHGIKRIVTFNADDFRRYASITVTLPT